MSEPAGAEANFASASPAAAAAYECPAARNSSSSRRRTIANPSCEPPCAYAFSTTSTLLASGESGLTARHRESSSSSKRAACTPDSGTVTADARFPLRTRRRRCFVFAARGFIASLQNRVAVRFPKTRSLQSGRSPRLPPTANRSLHSRTTDLQPGWHTCKTAPEHNGMHAALQYGYNEIRRLYDANE